MVNHLDSSEWLAWFDDYGDGEDIVFARKEAFDKQTAGAPIYVLTLPYNKGTLVWDNYFYEIAIKSHASQLIGNFQKRLSVK